MAIFHGGRCTHFLEVGECLAFRQVNAECLCGPRKLLVAGSSLTELTLSLNDDVLCPLGKRIGTPPKEPISPYPTLDGCL